MALTRPRAYQVDTTIESIVDPITVLHAGASSANVDVGFLINRANGLLGNTAIYWNESSQSFVTSYTTSSGGADSNIAVTSYANITTGNIYASGFFYANGQAFVPGTTGTGTNYGNLDVATFLPIYSGNVAALGVAGNLTVYGNLSVVGNITSVNYETVTYTETANIINASGNISTTANILSNSYLYSNGVSILSGINSAIFGIQANDSLFTTQISSINANIIGSNAAIVTANTAMKGYVDAVSTAWTANAGTQQGQITTLQGQVYANANVASYLPTYSGNITAGNVLASGFFYANGSPFVSSSYGNTNVAGYLPTYTGNIGGNTANVGNLITASGIFWANGNAYSSGSGTGSAKLTTSATAPTNPNVGDFWYDTTTDVLSQYIYNGAGSYWIDEAGASITNAPAPRFITITQPGSVYPSTGSSRFYSPKNINIVYMSASQGSASGVSFSIVKNGTVAASGNIAGGSYQMTAVSTNISLTTADYLTINVNSGSTSDLVVYLQYLDN